MPASGLRYPSGSSPLAPIGAILASELRGRHLVARVVAHVEIGGCVGALWEEVRDCGYGIEGERDARAAAERWVREWRQKGSG